MMQAVSSKKWQQIVWWSSYSTSCCCSWGISIFGIFENKFTLILGIFEKLECLMNLVHSGYLFISCLKYLAYLKFDIWCSSSQTSPSCCRSWGRCRRSWGRSSGRRRSQKHPLRTCRLLRKPSLLGESYDFGQSRYDFRHFLEIMENFTPFLLKNLAMFLYALFGFVQFSTKYFFKDRVCTCEPVHLFIQLLSQNSNRFSSISTYVSSFL